MLNILLMEDNRSCLFYLGLSYLPQSLFLQLPWHGSTHSPSSEPPLPSSPSPSYPFAPSFSELHDNKVISASVPLFYVDKDGIFHPVSLSRWVGTKPCIVNPERSVEMTRQRKKNKKLTSSASLEEFLSLSKFWWEPWGYCHSLMFKLLAFCIFRDMLQIFCLLCSLCM